MFRTDFGNFHIRFRHELQVKSRINNNNIILCNHYGNCKNIENRIGDQERVCVSSSEVCNSERAIIIPYPEKIYSLMRKIITIRIATISANRLLNPISSPD